MEPEEGISHRAYASHASLNRVTVSKKIGRLAVGDDIGGAGHHNYDS